MTQNSVALPPLDPRTVSATTDGVIDMFDYVDAVQGLFPHSERTRVPRGAPVFLSGWAVDPSGEQPPSAIAIVLDSTTVQAAETGLSRYDVKALLGAQTPEMIGFRAAVATENLVSGDHTIVVYALGADGAWYEAANQGFRLYGWMLPERGISARRMWLEIDAVHALAGGARGEVLGVVPHGQLALVSGWSADRETRRPPAGVCAIDAAGARWTAPCDLSRADVRTAIGGQDDHFGFEIAVPTDGLQRGPNRLEVWAFDDEGRRLGRLTEATFQVGLPVRPFPPFAEPLETAAPVRAQVVVRGPGAGADAIVLHPDRELTVNRGDVLEIEGWACLPHGEAPAELVLELHPAGVSLAMPPSRYHPVAGYARKKPPRTLAPAPREDAWFSYRLGTLLLSPHTYRLSVAVVAEGRSSFARGELGNVRISEPSR